MILKQDSLRRVLKYNFCLIIILFTTNNYSIVKIKVLIDQAQLKSTKSWNIDTTEETGLNLVYPQNKSCKKIIKPLKITVTKNEIFLNKIKYNKDIIQIKPVNGNLILDGKPYQGSFYIIKHPTKFMFINKVEIEDYVCSVLHTESWPGWSLEVNKILAIACRTYAASKALESKGKKKPFHIMNTNKHQTYGGAHHNQILRQAVEKTKGIVVGQNNKPILAMFDCCCGGIIPARIENFDFSKTPYLARTYACNFCKDCKIFSWKAEFSHANFEKIIKNKIEQFSKLKQITLNQDSAGLVKKVIIKDLEKDHHLDGPILYSMLKEIVSFNFSIEQTIDKIIITGKGYGHHMGLCQWGAKKMVDLGLDYKHILSFYYPETTLLRLQN